jgi:hypothetical protein
MGPPGMTTGEVFLDTMFHLAPRNQSLISRCSLGLVIGCDVVFNDKSAPRRHGTLCPSQTVMPSWFEVHT